MHLTLIKQQLLASTPDVFRLHAFICAERQVELKQIHNHPTQTNLVLYNPAVVFVSRMLNFSNTYFRCYIVHVVELLNYYTNYCTYIKFIYVQ